MQAIKAIIITVLRYQREHFAMIDPPFITIDTFYIDFMIPQHLNAGKTKTPPIEWTAFPLLEDRIEEMGQ